MKKIISLIFVLFLVGCSKEEYTTCNVEITNKVQNYEVTGVYKIYYEDNFVKRIEKKEEYISNDVGVIDYFDESKNLEYYNLNDLYDGFDYNINRSNTTVNLNVTINMKDVNIKQMVKDNYLDKDYVISNKLTVSGAKYFYEAKGAVCDI